MEKPQQTPEGKAIASRQRALGISTRAAARKVGLSEARWRQIVNGYQNVGQGLMVPVIGPAGRWLGWRGVSTFSSEYFQEIGREDVAAEMVGQSWAEHIASNPAPEFDPERELQHYEDSATARDFHLWIDTGQDNEGKRDQGGRFLSWFSDEELAREVLRRMRRKPKKEAGTPVDETGQVEHSDLYGLAAHPPLDTEEAQERRDGDVRGEESQEAPAHD